jgi:hypothetical protein
MCKIYRINAIVITIMQMDLSYYFCSVAITPNVTAQVSVDCSSQTITGIDCPDPEELNKDNNEEDGVNIEEQIPSVIPFP